MIGMSLILKANKCHVMSNLSREKYLQSVWYDNKCEEHNKQIYFFMIFFKLIGYFYAIALQ